MAGTRPHRQLGFSVLPLHVLSCNVHGAVSAFNTYEVSKCPQEENVVTTNQHESWGWVGVGWAEGIIFKNARYFAALVNLNALNKGHACATSALLSVPVRSMASCNRAASVGFSVRTALRLIAPPFARFIEASCHEDSQPQQINIRCLPMLLHH